MGKLYILSLRGRRTEVNTENILLQSGQSSGLSEPFVFLFTVFVLAIFVGFYVVWRVTPALHSPLMSVTNAISSVIIVGAIIAALAGETENIFDKANVFGYLAIILAAVNIFGGFLVTQRMLAMYKKKNKDKK